MTYIAYKDHKFYGTSLLMIERANAIIAEYEQQGFSLTLRQLYYQFVARDWLPNRQTSYDKLGYVMNEARLCGLVSWDAIQDRTRNLVPTDGSDTSPAAVLAKVRGSYRRELWADQPYVVEVWVEKEALIGIVERAAYAERCPYFACRGYTSQSEHWAAAQRIEQRYDETGQNQQTIVLHLGDHDPSGIDMTRDLQDRFAVFGVDEMVTVERIALNMDQVRRFNPPPNPAKLTDARAQGYIAQGYIAQYGNSSWELDALSPTFLSNLIRAKIRSYRDDEKWDLAVAREKREGAVLDSYIDAFTTPKSEATGYQG